MHMTMLHALGTMQLPVHSTDMFSWQATNGSLSKSNVTLGKVDRHKTPGDDNPLVSSHHAMGNSKLAKTMFYVFLIRSSKTSYVLTYPEPFNSV